MIVTDPVSRRQFLRAAGLALCLPFFPSLLRGSEAADPPREPTRLLFMSTPLGFVPNKWLTQLKTANTAMMCVNFNPTDSDGWFPHQDGPDYQLPEVHADLAPYRRRISFLKGLRNGRYRGNTHHGDDVLLTCADTFADPAKSFTNTVSCDQIAARSPALAPGTVRHRFLALGISPCLGTKTGSLSWGERGTPITAMKSPAEVFDLLFGVEKEPLEARLERLRRRKSILDQALADIRQLSAELNAADRDKLDEAATAVRDIEARIQQSEHWIGVPKPEVAMARPANAIPDSGAAQHMTAMFDLIHAAFLTDTTRVVTYQLPASPRDVSPADKHTLNHAQGDAALAEDHRRLDRHLSKQVAHLLARLDGSVRPDGKTLLHHTLATYGSGCWGPIHGTYSLPVMLLGEGGGRIRQGITQAFPNPTPMANLWLTMLRAAGCEVDRFADSTGTLDALLA